MPLSRTRSMWKLLITTRPLSKRTHLITPFMETELLLSKISENMKTLSKMLRMQSSWTQLGAKDILEKHRLFKEERSFIPPITLIRRQWSLTQQTSRSRPECTLSWKIIWLRDWIHPYSSLKKWMLCLLMRKLRRNWRLNYNRTQALPSTSLMKNSILFGELV